MSSIVTDIAERLEVVGAIRPAGSVMLHMMQLKGPRILLAPPRTRPAAGAARKTIAIQSLSAHVVRNVPVVFR